MAGKMAHRVSRRLDQVLEYVKAHERPTVQQIAIALDMGYQMAHDAVRRLIVQGELKGGAMIGGNKRKEPSMEVTAKQKAILDWLRSEAAESRYPSIREICDQFKIKSPNGVICHLAALARKGFITKGATARSIRLVGEGKDAAARLTELNGRVEGLIGGEYSIDEFKEWYAAWKGESE